MNVSEAVENRMSVRAFLDTPIPKESIETILKKASRAPSGGNLQPWQVHVVTGVPLKEFVDDISIKVGSGQLEQAEYDSYPEKLWSPYRDYRYATGEALYELIGIARDDKFGRLGQFAQNFKFFGAPVALFFTLDRRFINSQWADMGMFLQTIMLLATEAGLDTCPQRCWLRFPQSIKEFLGLVDSQAFFCAMALGYRDRNAKINELRIPRADIGEFTKFIGFDGANK